MDSDAEIVKLSTLAAINPARKVKRGTDVPFVDMAALPTHGRDIQSVNISRRTARGAGAHFQNGDTLLARITPCLENGKTAQVRCLDDGSIAEGSTEFIVLAGNDQADNDYVYYLCRSPDFRDFAIKRMEGTSGRQRVSWNTIAEYEFACPEPEVRRWVAQVLSSLDDRVDLLRQTNITLEAIVQALFKSWFVDFDPVHAKAEDREPEVMDAATAALFPSEFEESELGPIPKGWRTRSLDSVATYLNGLALQKFPAESESEFLPVIKIAQLRAGTTAGSDRASAHLKPEYVLHDGDVLFSWSGSLEVEFWCGGDGALNQHLFKVTSDEVPKWFYYLATRIHLPEFRRVAASKATTMGHIQRKHLAQAKIAAPPPEVLAAATKIIEPLLDRRITNSLQMRELAQLRDTLLPRLISGKLHVPDATKPEEVSIA